MIPPVSTRPATLPPEMAHQMNEAARKGQLPVSSARGVKAALSEDQISSMRPAKVFRDAVRHSPQKQITSLSFSDSGETCITSGQDENITIWNCVAGKRENVYPSKKYGVHHVTATHVNGNILHASTKGDDAIRYFSAATNTYERYFRGHESRVTSVSMNPTEDSFLSGDSQSLVMLWDLRSDRARGKLREMGGTSLVAFDSTGLFFAVGLPEEVSIALYDAKSFDRAPFCSGPILDPELAKITSPPRKILMTSLSFSNNGKYILAGTSGDTHYILDSFSLQVVARLMGHKGLERDANGNVEVTPRVGDSGHELSWSPDSQYVLSGSHTGEVVVWHIVPRKDLNHQDLLPVPQPDPNSGLPRRSAPEFNPIARLNVSDPKNGQSRVVGFNPKYCMFVSGGHEVVMWLPKRDRDDDADMDIDDEE